LGKSRLLDCGGGGGGGVRLAQVQGSLGGPSSLVDHRPYPSASLAVGLVLISKCNHVRRVVVVVTLVYRFTPSGVLLLLLIAGAANPRTLPRSAILGVLETSIPLRSSEGQMPIYTSSAITTGL
jgi:hypothetical protein